MFNLSPSAGSMLPLLDNKFFAKQTYCLAASELAFSIRIGNDIPREFKPDPLIGERIINFLRLGRLPARCCGLFGYCCVDFINELVFGRGKIGRSNFSASNWDGVEVDWWRWSLFSCSMPVRPNCSRENSNNYETNDIVVFVDDNDYFKHIAYSIGGGLFLSLFGSAGPLIVCDLEELMNAFSATKHFQVHPKKSKFNIPTCFV